MEMNPPLYFNFILMAFTGNVFSFTSKIANFKK